MATISQPYLSQRGDGRQQIKRAKHVCNEEVEPKYLNDIGCQIHTLVNILDIHLQEMSPTTTKEF